jgi:hypothetical protein
MDDMTKTNEEPLVHVMTTADALSDEGHPTGEIVAALLSCALIQMIEHGVTQQRALELFKRSAHFAYNQGDPTHDHH